MNTLDGFKNKTREELMQDEFIIANLDSSLDYIKDEFLKKFNEPELEKKYTPKS